MKLSLPINIVATPDISHTAQIAPGQAMNHVMYKFTGHHPDRLDHPEQANSHTAQAMNHMRLIQSPNLHSSIA